jgi:hypothetical protein
MPQPLWIAREAAWKRDAYQAETKDEERRRMALQRAYFAKRGWKFDGYAKEWVRDE